MNNISYLPKPSMKCDRKNTLYLATIIKSVKLNIKPILH